MFWMQATLSFAVWVVYGIVQMRQSARIRAWGLGLAPRVRTGLGVGLFLLAGALLFGSLLLMMQFKVITPQGLLPLAWFLMTVGGVVLVHLQTLATALIVLAAQATVTEDRLAASRTAEEHDRA